MTTQCDAYSRSCLSRGLRQCEDRSNPGITEFIHSIHQDMLNSSSTLSPGVNTSYKYWRYSFEKYRRFFCSHTTTQGDWQKTSRQVNKIISVRDRSLQAAVSKSAVYPLHRDPAEGEDEVCASQRELLFLITAKALYTLAVALDLTR